MKDGRERQIRKDADQSTKSVIGSLDTFRDALALSADDPERFQALQIASASIITKLDIVKGAWATTADKAITRFESDEFKDKREGIDPMSAEIMEPMKEAMFDVTMETNLPLEDVPLFAWYTAARWYKKQTPKK